MQMIQIIELRTQYQTSDISSPVSLLMIPERDWAADV